MGIKILSCGSYTPEKILTNFDLEGMVDTSDEWITTRTGIKERRIAEQEKTSDLATKAVERAIEGINPEDFGLIIVATSTPDMFFPSTACIVQANIGNTGAVAFDLSAACTGFVYGLYVADSIMRSKNIDMALVVGAERFSRIVNWKDRTTCILFGDAAGAVVLGRSDEEGILAFDLGADGSYGDLLYVESVGSDSDFPYYVKMRGNEVFKVAVRMMAESAMRVIDKAGLLPSDVSLLIPHQANVRILRAVAERIGIPEEKIFLNLPKYGNTSAASIPLALDEAIRAGKIGGGDVILMIAFGGGFTWGSCVLRL